MTITRTYEAFEQELTFWEEQIAGVGQYSAGVRMRLDLSTQPPEYRTDIEPIILALGEAEGRKARVLDVGSGPASVLSYGHAQGRFDLLAADPLADAYRGILERHGFKPTSPMLACGGEELDQHLEPKSFDFVWSWNAIDHAENPAHVFDQMVTVTRPGGIIFVAVFEDEGTAAVWSGLHQHNISEEDGWLYCTTRQGQRTRLFHRKLKRFEMPPLTLLPHVEGRRFIHVAFQRVMMVPA